MEVIIRKIQEADNVALAKIIREVFVEHDAPKQGTVFSDPTTDNLFQLFKTPKSILWVAETDGQWAGCCGIYPTPGLPKGCCELVKFYLAASARGKGIGNALLQKSIESANALGYKQIYLESLPHFGKAISMYKKNGFAMIDQAMCNSAHNSCNIWMLKEL